ncbi:MAG: mechanosensitive ion channel [Chloroflexi bacterium]|nr:mechanosensitive ion channel [Chloroflexota bacterium]
MELPDIQAWIVANPPLALGVAALLFLLIYLLTRLIFGRGLIYVTTRTKNKYDDIIVKKLRPYRASLLAPFAIAYAFAYLAPDVQPIIEKVALFFILWITILTLNGLMDAFNQIYESSPSFTGVSIQGYLDIAKIVILMVGIILSISLITGESPLLLLSGLGALTAVLLLIFHDTIMALIASIQISAHNLVKEGDWLEVPSYEADGVVTNMTLHTIKIQNWDMTITVIPTHKIIETAYKNWRGMQESGGRRIMRSIRLDQNAVRFCTPEMIERYAKIDLIAGYVAKRRVLADEYKSDNAPLDSPLDGPQITNMEIFRAYIEAYLKNHPDIHTKKMDLIVRELAPTSTGLPVEMYMFTKTTKWNDYERIQAEIVDHLLAAAAFFDLRLFQEPAGSDFASALRLERAG